MCSNEVSDNFTPVDSTYTKTTLTGLHPNIMVQRSPSHFQTGTFYWSHVSTLRVAVRFVRWGLEQIADQVARKAVRD
jgi:hypothetical protein